MKKLTFRECPTHAHTHTHVPTERARDYVWWKQIADEKQQMNYTRNVKVTTAAAATLPKKKKRQQQ